MAAAVTAAMANAIEIIFTYRIHHLKDERELVFAPARRQRDLKISLNNMTQGAPRDNRRRWLSAGKRPMLASLTELAAFRPAQEPVARVV